MGAKAISHDVLLRAVSGSAAAMRVVSRLEPAGGPGDKIFPPTYEGGKNAEEPRRIDGQEVTCVLLDSVQSQANRMELELLNAWERGRLALPVISVDFAGAGLPEVGRITSLEAPHRIADAILRDSLFKNQPFRKSEIGQKIDQASLRNATPIFELCPTALLFGMWDSTGPKGGLGVKFARAIVSEIVGCNAVRGVKTASRIDPLQLQLQAGPLYKAEEGGWTLNPDEALKEKKAPMKLGKDGRPSEANHGNVTPTIAEGGYTIDHAIHTAVLSFPALRRLRFPINGKSSPDVDDAARTLLAALGLCAVTLAMQQGYDLRSRCQLVAVEAPEWELLDQPGQPAQKFSLSADDALETYKAAVEQVRKLGLPLLTDELKLTPSPQLAALVTKSRQLASNQQVEEK